MFVITKEEYDSLRCNFYTSSSAVPEDDNLMSKISTSTWGGINQMGDRCVGFSEGQAATINRITVATEISEKPPPFRLVTLYYR